MQAAEAVVERKVTQSDLDRVIREVGRPRDVADIYPATPLQRGLLFHALLQRESSVYVSSLSWKIEGELDVETFRRAWQAVVDRHDALRTVFGGLDLGTPLQVVLRHVPAPLTVLDWRGQGEERQRERLAALLDGDQAHRFELTRPALVHITLARTGEREFRLIWSNHHLIIDGWCRPILLAEIFGIYASLRSGARPSLPPVRQYREYVAWLRKQGGAEAEAYWRRTLAGWSPAPLLGMASAARPVAAGEAHFQDHSCVMAADLARLNEFAKRNKITLNTLLQATWSLLLRLYEGRDDVVFGVTLSGRPADLPGVETMIGLFVNMLPMRIRIDAAARVDDWLRDIHRNQTELLSHDYSSLAQVQKWVDLPPGDSLVESVVVLENYPMDVGSAGAGDPQALAFKEFETRERPHMKLRLAFMAQQTLQLKAHFDTRFFDRGTVLNLVSQFDHLLGQLVSRPEARVGDIAALAPAARRQLVEEWNGTSREVAGWSVAQRIGEVARQRPDEAAVRSAAGSLTYGELWERSGALAAWLRAQGVGADGVVGVVLGRSVDLVVSVLAVLRAGGAYLPLDPGYPAQRLQEILTDARARVVLTQERFASVLVPGGGERRLLSVDREWSQVLEAARARPFEDGAVSGEDLAYVIYTSGSTGKPKGVMVRHGSLSNYAQYAAERFEVAAGDGAPIGSSLSFDLVLTSFYPVLISGRCLRLCAEEHGAGGLAQTLAESRDLSPVKLTPSHLDALSELLPWAGLEGRVRTLVVGGEALNATKVRAWQERTPGTRIYNHYGPTETTIGCIVHEVDAKRAYPGPIPIGKPIWNTQVYVLDERLEPVPVGVTGELYIGGAGLARGYLHRPGLTAERFIANPFGTGGSRLYRTGDLVRYLPDGELEFVRRVDHQVKIRGFRIELQEIDSCLSGHPGVRHCAVLVREESGHKQLVAYVVPAGSGAEAVQAAQLRTYLQEKLPEYMVPQAYVLLEQLPLTANGKLDRKALPAPNEGEQQGYVEASSPTERLLVELWSKALNVARVGIHDNFFEIGGDSIIAIQITARAAQAGVRFSIKHLIEQQTIARLAVVCTVAEAAQIDQSVVEGAVPLTPIQHWFFEGDSPEPHHFNQAVLLKCRRRLSAERVSAVWERLLAHHDALRLRAVRAADGWQLRNAGLGETVSLQRIDLAALPAGETAARLTAEAQRLQESLQLGAGPLVRLALFEMGADEPQRLLIVIHHLAVDGVSWRILLEDFHLVYQQLEAGEAVKLAAKSTSFRSWALKLDEYAQQPAAREQLGYWLALPWQKVVPLPRDLPDGDNSGASMRSVQVSLDAAQTRALLQEVPSAYGTQVNDVLLTALVEAFGRFSGGRTLLINMEGHGREELFGPQVDLSRTVGWFTTHFPVLLDLSEAGEQIGQKILAVKEQLQALPQRGIGYGILRYLTGEPALKQLPHPEVSFNYLGQFGGAEDEAALFEHAAESAGEAQSLSGPRRRILSINGAVHGDCLQFSWQYSHNLHHTHTIEKLAADFKRALLDIADSRGKACVNTPASAAPLPRALVTRGTGPIPFTPHQRRWIELYPHGFQRNVISLIYECADISEPALRSALQLLVEEHDALRLKITWHDTEWRQAIVPVSDATAELLRTVDLSQVDEAAQEQAIREWRTRAESSLDLSQPPLMRALLLNLRGATHQRLIIAMHHFVTDVVSAGVLVNDLHRFHAECAAGVTPSRTQASASFHSWATGLEAYARSAAAMRDLCYWHSLPWSRHRPLPVDYPLGIDSVETQQSLSQSLDPERTQLLMKNLPRRHAVLINEVLLAGLSTALAQWTRQDAFLVNVMHHGRADILPQLDISRTVGWFSSEVPVLIDLGTARGPAETLQAVKAQMRAIPGEGVSFGILRYMAEANLVASLPLAQIRLNHIGVVSERDAETGSPPTATFRVPASEGRHALERRARFKSEYLIELVTFVSEGRLHARWFYGANKYRQQTIQSLAEGFTAALISMLSAGQERAK